jgi:fibronectin type 3 domain-containing protein
MARSLSVAFSALHAVPMALALAAVSACHGPDPPPPLPPPWISLSSMTEVSYDTQWAKLLLTGTLTLSDATDLTMIRFHLVPVCDDAPVGQGLVSDFAAGGLLVTVPSSGYSPIYADTNTDGKCTFVVGYNPLHAAPPAPGFSSTQPPSPSRVNTTPYIVGTVSGDTITVNLYSDSACSQLLASGSAGDFTHVGIQVTLQPNTTTTIYAQALEPFGHASACALLTSYTHTTVAPPPPSLAATVPPSPNNFSTTPSVVGQVSVSTATVALYSDPACTVSLAGAAASAFTTGGIPISVSTNTVTTIYGTATDLAGNVSACGYLITYENNTIAPDPPTYTAANPVTPTRLTIYPLISGVVASRTVKVNLFSDSGCATLIGTGTPADYQGAGITASCTGNATTTIYGQDVDDAGNSSSCAPLVDYVNNSISPPDPAFNISNPISPNNKSTTPLILGAAGTGTVSMALYSDAACTQVIGTGSADTFFSPGIQVTVPNNQSTPIYGIGTDNVGNQTDCTFLANYATSTDAAPAAAFSVTLPASPSNISYHPFVVGTAATTVVNVTLYSDSGCGVQVGTGHRSTYVTSGVMATLTPDSETAIYAVTTDIYGNLSPCTYLTTYIHDNVLPFAPTFVSTTPASPTNQSTSPLVKGSALDNPAKLVPTTTVSLYDSAICSNRIGSGTRAAFTSPGVIVNVPPNATTTIYARSIDQATNQSACTFLTSYTHKNIPPANPTFVSASPPTPSYTQQTVILGHDSPDTDHVTLFTDPACASSIITGSYAQWTISGFPVTAAENATTTIYGIAYDIETNQSACTHLVDYVHSDLGPSSLTAATAQNGAVTLNWLPDVNATAYIIKRAIRTGGPYTIIAPANQGNFYVDTQVSNNVTYYYVVASTNATGTSFNSSEAAAAVSLSPPTVPSGLAAAPGPASIQLTWFGTSDALSYNVYRASRTGGPYVQVAHKLVTSAYLDSAVSNDVPYYYVVSGENPAGEGAYSAEASAVPKDIPAAPTNLSVAYVNGYAQLSWSAPSYYNQFHVKRGTTSGGEVTYATVAGTNYLDLAPVYPGYHNYYVVTATLGVLESLPSNEVEMPDFIPSVVTASPGDQNVALDWTATTGATTYDILRGTIPGGPYTTIASALPGPPYADAPVTNGVTYRYVVAANFANGPPMLSLEVDATPATMPGGPTNLSYNIGSLGGVNLAWTPPAYFNSFNVYRASALAGPYSFLANSPGAAYTDNVPLPGANYYRVTVQWGSGETAASNTVFFENAATAGLAAVPGSGKITLNWTATTGATNYTIVRATSYGGATTTVAAAATGTSFQDTTVTNNKGYFYSIAPNFGGGKQGKFSAQVGAMTGGGAVPSGLTVTAVGGSNATLVWAPVAGASSYNIYTGNSSSGPWSPNSSPSTTQATASGLHSSSTVFFSVTSVISGNESAKSTAVSVYTSGSVAAPGVTADSSQVDLTWSFVSGAVSYVVQSSTDSVNFSTIATGVTTVTYTDTTAVNGTQYFYRIQPVFPGPYPFYSSVSAGVTPGIVPLTPTVPYITDNSNGTSVNLTWNSIPGATSINIKQGAVSGGPYSTVLTTAGTTATVTGLTAGTSYFFVISALDGNVESGNSPEVRIVPLASPAAPAVTISGGQVQVTITAVPGATSYDILRSTDAVNFATIASGSASTSYSDSTTSAGQSYYYKYLPYLPGPIAAAVSLPSVAVTPGVAPLAPSALVAIATGSTSAVLSWVQDPNVTGYDLYRGTVSGGPYVSVAQPVPPGATDSGLTPGSTYYYVVAGINSSGVESAYSNEVAVDLVSAPTGLVAVAAAGVVNLSWNAAGGATGYDVLRGSASGGPYGVLTQVAGTSYTDAAVVGGTTYYYVVTADFSGGSRSPESNEANATASQPMNLQVPIELTDQPVSSSDSGATVFQRTQTSLDPTAYDGTVTYSLELVATNADTSPAVVTLVDSTGTGVGSVSVPAGTAQATRLRASVTPNPALDIYRLSVPQTTDFGDLQIYSARLLVTQTGATKTKLYIPLLSSSNGPSAADVLSPTEVTAATTYDELPSGMIYVRDPTVFANLSDFEAWQLETLVATTGGMQGAVALIDMTQAATVVDTETLFTGGSVVMASSPLNEGAAGFAAANNGDDYEISIRCAGSCSSGDVELYKAGLWVTLVDLSQAEVTFRNSLASNSAGPLMLASERVLMDLSVFSNPSVFFEAVGAVPISSTSVDVSLYSDASDDSGVASTSAIAGSDLQFTGPFKTRLRTSSPLTINSGDRFITNVNPTGGGITHTGSSIVIETHR